MSVTITNCPYEFHDAEELLQFLRHCGTLVWLFDGQTVCFDGCPVLVLRMFFQLQPLRTELTYHPVPRI